MMGSSRVYDYAALNVPVEHGANPGDLVSVEVFSREEIRSLFELTNIIKHRPADFRAALAGKQIVLFFEKASLRTRLTFEAGMASLGGNSMFFDQTRSRLHEREPLRDIAHNVERWVDPVVLRTYDHQTTVDMPEHRPRNVTNAVSDVRNPSQ